MKDPRRIRPIGLFLLGGTLLSLCIPLGGCGPNYRYFRREGQNAALNGNFGPARYFFIEAQRRRPRDVENLHDLGVCSLVLAKDKFQQMNHPAALRELDDAIGYFSQAIDAQPGHQASIEGKNRALELKGQFDEALELAEWTAEFVGPSAKQHIFLADELEERGDLDGALLRYRQAVAMEPDNPDAHLAFAKFLMRRNNETAAIHHLQAAYRLNPRDEWVIDQLVARSALPPLKPLEEGDTP